MFMSLDGIGFLALVSRSCLYLCLYLSYLFFLEAAWSASIDYGWSGYESLQTPATFTRIVFGLREHSKLVMKKTTADKKIWIFVWVGIKTEHTKLLRLTETYSSSKMGLEK